MSDQKSNGVPVPTDAGTRVRNRDNKPERLGAPNSIAGTLVCGAVSNSTSITKGLKNSIEKFLPLKRNQAAFSNRPNCSPSQL